MFVRFRAIGILLRCWWECKMAQPLGKKGLTVSQTVKATPTVLTILLIDIHPRGMQTYVHSKTSRAA